MFSQLQFVRLRAAEKALRDGQLEEALRLATAQDLKTHRRAAAVLTDLAQKYLERARAHFRADRFADALSDLDKAEVAGAKGDEFSELRRNVQIVAHEVRRQDHSHRGKIEAARRRIEQGSLAAGQRMLDDVAHHDPAVVQIKQDAAHRAEEVDQLITHAERLLKEGYTSAALARLERAASLDRHHVRLAALREGICQKALDKVRALIKDGRLARASDELAGLGTLGSETPERRELADALAAAREASAALTDGRYSDARRHILTFQRVAGQPKWTHQVMDHLKHIDELYTALSAGPLGDRLNGTRHNTPERPARARMDAPVPRANRNANPLPRLDETIRLPARGRTGMPDRLLLLVDGGGSYLIIREPRASVGRAASNKPADVPLMGDLGERHASIERVDEDYFVVSAKGVDIGGRMVHHGLLRDGDRVVCGRKAKFTFRLPSRRSTTAVLDLSDTTKMPNDVRRVVLFDKHATLGDGPQAHMRCRHAGPPLLLIEKDGALWIRQRNDGHVDGEAQRLDLGQTVEIGGARVVLSEWKPQTGIVA